MFYSTFFSFKFFSSHVPYLSQVTPYPYGLFKEKKIVTVEFK